MSVVPLLREALARREGLLASLAAEGTECVRLLHGAVEGAPGLTVDRYGPLLWVQTFREPLAEGEAEALAGAASQALGVALTLVHRDRAGRDHPPLPAAEGRELGLRYAVGAPHAGQDPPLFLDMRAGRRWVRDNARGEVLNAFAYTCGLGVAAAAAGASVLNLDFSLPALELGRHNAGLNGVGERFTTARADAIPALRQLAGLPVKGRGARRGYRRFEARQFDLVVMDPPTWATSAFGAVDLVRDYPALFKPAALATRPGGALLVSNHVSTVDLDDWLDVLRRCAAKAGRPVREVEVLAPEADFPSPDGRHPLKLAVVRV